MRRAQTILPAGRWDKSLERGTVTLGWDDRHRRRIALRTDQGEDFLLDLADAARLAEGDGLALEDGSAIRVIAAPEPVLEIRAGQTGLARLAYHLGNRHLPVQIADDLLVIRADVVIAEMVVGLGGQCRETLRPFTPEAGAYDVPAASHHADHDHGHGHDHHHGHHHSHD